MIPPLPDISNANNVVPFNPHRSNGFQKVQDAVIVAVAKAEDKLVAVGVPRSQARVVARAVVYAFLEHLEPRTDPVCRVFDAYADYIAVTEAPVEGGVA